MNLELLQRQPAKHVPAHSILDYEAFSEGFHDPNDARELNVFEKFIAAGILVREGYDTYLNPFFKSDDQDSTFEADACGIKGGEILVAFCATGFPEKQVWNAIGIVSKSENARALIVSPQEIDRETIEGQAPGAIEKGKVRVETLGWFDDTLEQALQQTLHTVELLVNETRMRMLTPLLHKSALKRDFRARINPKLVYHNLATLSEAGLVDEPAEGTYELSQLGKTMLADFIAFLERARRTLDDHRNEEVKSIGRR